MATARDLPTEEDLRCAVCLDVFTDPVRTPCGHDYCRTCITRYWDTNDVCRCPLCAKVFHERPEVSVDTSVSEMVHRFRSHKWKEEYEAKTEPEIQQMIRERRVKIQEVKHLEKLSRKDADAVLEDSVQIFTTLIRCIQRSQAELVDAIEEKKKTTEKQAEGFIEDLQKEMTQLEERSSELKQRSHTKDLLQSVTSINTPPPTKDWTKVNALKFSYVGTLRTVVAQLVETLSEVMEKKLGDAELRKIQQYAVNVTLDPDTAHPELSLSEDGKQVSHGDTEKNVPDNRERFSPTGCVLGKQSFSSGRFYYEVQVGGKTGWDLGVARESIDRKEEEIVLSPNNGYWNIKLINGNEYWAADDPYPVPLPVGEELQKVGVFVDYEEGLVSFYDVEARVHLYSYTGCTFFTEKLFPFFSPCLNDGGTNSAPLIISPVNIEAALGGDGGNMSL